MKSRILPALLVVIGSGGALAQAADMGPSPPNEIRVGMYAIFYSPSAQDISGPYVPSGLNLDVHNVQTLYLAYERQLTQHWGLELAAGWPPVTRTYGRGPATVGSVPYDGKEISSAKWAAPSALVTYKFLDDSHVLRPYLGVGLTYVNFFDRQSTAAGNAIAGGPTQISLPSSIGPTATAGLAWRIAQNWGAYASYSISRVRTHLAADTAGVWRTTNVSFAPGALVVSLGYSF